MRIITPNEIKVNRNLSKTAIFLANSESNEARLEKEWQKTMIYVLGGVNSNVISINEGGFQYKDNYDYDTLESVYLPKSITSIGKEAFKSTALEYIWYSEKSEGDEGEESWNNITLGDDWIDKEIQVYCAEDGKYAQATVTFKFIGDENDSYAPFKDDNGNDIKEEVKVNYGAKVKPINSSGEKFIYPGHIFNGWNIVKDDDSQVAYDISSTLVVKDITLVTTWEDKSVITITLNATDGYFDDNPGTKTKSVGSVKYNDKLSNYTLDEPECDGNDFAGWWDAPNGGNLYTKDSRITAGGSTAMTLYAHWTEKTDN